MFFNNQLFKEKNTIEIRIYLETIQNKNRISQNLLDP